MSTTLSQVLPVPGVLRPRQVQQPRGHCQGYPRLCPHLILILILLQVMERFWFGDWFILMQLCKNMDDMVFHELVIDLKDRMETTK